MKLRETACSEAILKGFHQIISNSQSLSDLFCFREGDFQNKLFYQQTSVNPDGGFNPVEEYARQMGSFPQFLG